MSRTTSYLRMIAMQQVNTGNCEVSTSSTDSYVLWQLLLIEEVKEGVGVGEEEAGREGGGIYRSIRASERALTILLHTVRIS